MKYSSFLELVEQLPFNRKERFFTATIFPSILLNGDRSNLYAFLDLIEGFPTGFTRDSVGDSFLFYTEYMLKQAAGTIDALSGDTPDALIYFAAPQRALVSIEAKMFERTGQGDLDDQIRGQLQNVLTPIMREKQLTADEVFQIGLVPEGAAVRSTSAYQVLHWDTLLDENRFRLADCYFAHFLRYALNNYATFLSSSSGKASTVEGMWPGARVLEEARAGRDFWVGTQGGEKRTVKDIEQNSWEKKLYNISAKKPLKGRAGNWFHAQRFLALVNQYIFEDLGSVAAHWPQLDQPVRAEILGIVQSHIN